MLFSTNCAFSYVAFSTESFTQVTFLPLSGISFMWSEFLCPKQTFLSYYVVAIRKYFFSLLFDWDLLVLFGVNWDGLGLIGFVWD